MCFTLELKGVKKGVVPKPNKAKENIIVFKALSGNDVGPYYGLRINGKPDRYTKGFVYNETTPFKKASHKHGHLYIEGHCFHVCKTRELAKGHTSNVRVMVIPKGSLYYENDGEYVTNRLWYPVSQDLREIRKELRTKK